MTTQELVSKQAQIVDLNNKRLDLETDIRRSIAAAREHNDRTRKLTTERNAVAEEVRLLVAEVQAAVEAQRKSAEAEAAAPKG